MANEKEKDAVRKKGPTKVKKAVTSKSITNTSKSVESKKNTPKPRNVGSKSTTKTDDLNEKRVRKVNQDNKVKKVEKNTQTSGISKTRKRTQVSSEKKIEKPIKIEKEKITQTKKNKIELSEVEIELEKNRKISIEKKKIIRKEIFPNLGLAIFMILYFTFLFLGQRNIEINTFSTDLKVFTMISAVIAIILFEKAFKESKKNIIYMIFGIEAIIIAITDLFLEYVLNVNKTMFNSILLYAIIITTIYYIVKSIIMAHKMKKKYIMDEIKEIVKK